MEENDGIKQCKNFKIIQLQNVKNDPQVLTVLLFIYLFDRKTFIVSHYV